MKLNILKLAKLSKAFQKGHADEIRDIILFGSVLRGKSEPGDIDILMLFNAKINRNIEYEFKKQASKIIKNLSLVSTTENMLYAPSFAAREAILFEGYSLIEKQFIASHYGFDSCGIFIYSTKKLKNVEKTKFYYALNGRRSSPGVIDSLKAIKLSDSMISVPLENVEEAKEFFDQQNIEFKYVPSLLPSRLAKKRIIGKN
ncbi:MAG: nucleotidyltransferase domain-containing protein [Nanoarchaeota archaeon]|nr:nucleotidyltransferase domain-containing protein [Nanoarchaeota archaeon]